MCRRRTAVHSESYTSPPKWFLYSHAHKPVNTALYTSNLLDLYLSKLPQKAFTQELDVFYLRPLEKMPSDPNHPWYTNVPVGKNTLERKQAIVCNRAFIEGYRSITNHSLRATSGTQMYRNGVPEKVIQERTDSK